MTKKKDEKNDNINNIRNTELSLPPTAEPVLMTLSHHDPFVDTLAIDIKRSVYFTQMSSN